MTFLNKFYKFLLFFSIIKPLNLFLIFYKKNTFHLNQPRESHESVFRDFTMKKASVAGHGPMAQP
jgi:hypothetical protein